MQLSPLAHDRAGTGEPVVLIHGIGHRRGAWQPIFDQLSERYDVIAVDLAGFGESPGYPAGTPYTMDNACADLAANFEAWGVSRPHVVGNSLGGALALELGARDLVSSVTAISPAGFFGRVERFQALLPLAVMRLASQLPDRVLQVVSRSAAGRRLVGAPLYAHPERMTAYATYQDCLAMKHSTGFFPAARSGIGYSFEEPVEVPTTVAWGTKDRLLPYRQSRTARLRLTGARHVPLKDCGHVPMIDAPEAIIDLIDEVVARAATTGADVA
ncbi:alpha/beta fold hydrolase [Nocardioides jensenii]|uniref:alpha/beta fold hydrolase n=1 Tax=Nocardioides jensenii TaxID=1843 RepID=UPI00082A96F5|nr:alpha/beta hydrolase [Nocardioides jensenii]